MNALLYLRESARLVQGRSIRPTDQAQINEMLRSARMALDSERFDHAWEAGAQLTLGEAIAFGDDALRDLDL